MRKLSFVFAILLIVLSMNGFCLADELQDAYNAALLLLTQGKYAEAAQAFDNLFGYEDSNLYATYAKGLNAGENGNFELALQAFEMLGDFRDSAFQYRYYQARQYESWDDFGSWDQAITIYEEMQLFRDCYSRIEGINERKQDRYDDALEMGRSGAYVDAAIAFSEMDGYGRSEDYNEYYWILDAEQTGDFYSALYYLAWLRNHSDFEKSQDLYVSYGDAFIKTLVVGQTVNFGYSCWYILDIDKSEKRILLLLTDTLDHYCEYKMCTWENSEMREWLNRSYDGFLNNNYFHDYDYDLIETTLVRQSAGTDFSDGTFDIIYMGADSDVYDKVFALSFEEAQMYLPIIGTETDLPGYWLRDTYAKYSTWGYEHWENYGYYIHNGEIQHIGNSNSTKRDIRPALWVNFD